MRRAIRLTTVIGVPALLLMGVLTGCSPTPVAPAQPPPAPTASTSTPSPTPSPTLTADTLGHGAPLGYSCDELIAPETVDRFDSHLDVRPHFAPSPSSSAERAVKIRGTACEWIDSSTGTSLVVSVAHPDAPTLLDLSAHTATYAHRTSVFGGAPQILGYYSGPQMEVYTAAGFWITASSPLFTDPIHAQSIVHAALEALPN